MCTQQLCSPRSWSKSSCDLPCSVPSGLPSPEPEVWAPAPPPAPLLAAAPPRAAADPGGPHCGLWSGWLSSMPKALRRRTQRCHTAMSCERKPPIWAAGRAPHSNATAMHELMLCCVDHTQSSCRCARCRPAQLQSICVWLQSAQFPHVIFGGRGSAGIGSADRQQQSCTHDFAGSLLQNKVVQGRQVQPG